MYDEFEKAVAEGKLIEKDGHLEDAVGEFGQVMATVNTVGAEWELWAAGDCDSYAMRIAGSGRRFWVTAPLPEEPDYMDRLMMWQAAITTIVAQAESDLRAEWDLSPR